MKIRDKKGISLITLVITIIIMIILAASIILSLSGSDIINKANTAKTDNDVATIKERELMELAEYELKKASGESVGTVKEYIEEKLPGYYANESGAIVATKRTEGTGDDEVTVPIPLGFTYREGTKDTGIVIADAEGNEFVWVPVDNYSKFSTTTTYDGTITNPNYTESIVTYNYEDIAGTEYNNMKKSVEDNGGFYIGRYEAGSETKRTSAGTTKLVVKKGAYAYNYVLFDYDYMFAIGLDDEDLISQFGPRASNLSKNLYANSKSVVSTLCYGVQWDAALQFIYKTDNSYPTNSTSKGWYTGVSGNSDHKTGMDMEGSANRLNNIYDMAGNVSEWTMEQCGMNYISRGGNYQSSVSNQAASQRDDDEMEYTISESIGFRVTLYIK